MGKARADSFDQRLARAREQVAPAEPVAFSFVAVEGGFVITALTEADIPAMQAVEV